MSSSIWTNAPVLIRDGRIVAVGSGGDALPDQTLDLQGQHLYPGLIAPTTVLGLLEIDGVRATRDTTEVGEFTPDVSAWVAVNPDPTVPPAPPKPATPAPAAPAPATPTPITPAP